MSPLVAAYENPTGEMTVDTAADVGEGLLEAYEATREYGTTDVMREAVERLQDVGGGEADDSTEGDGAGAQRVNGSVLDVAAVAHLHRICKGWEDRIDESANGFIDLTATFDNGGLIPVVWGSGTKCRYQRRDRRVEITGDIRIRFGTTQPRVGLRYLTHVSYLVNFIGDTVFENGDTRTELTLNSHFQAFPDGKVRMLVTVPGGATFVAEVDVFALDPAYGEPMLDAGVFAADSFWNCTIGLQTFSGTCSNADDPDTVVSW